MSDDGTSGQDRESYTDDQDRDSYTVDDERDLIERLLGAALECEAWNTYSEPPIGWADLMREAAAALGPDQTGLYTGPDDRAYTIKVRVIAKPWPQSVVYEEGEIDMPLSVFNAGWRRK